MSPSGQEDTAGLVLNNMVSVKLHTHTIILVALDINFESKELYFLLVYKPVLQEEDEESVYANKTVLSESLHYSTIKFPNREGSEIRGLSSLTAKYATIHHGAGPQSKGETGEAAIEEVQEENVMNMDSVMMQNSVEEEVTYGNIKHKPTVKQTQVNLDEGDDGSKKSKETKEAKERASEQLGHSDGAEGIYAQVKPRKHEHE